MLKDQFVKNPVSGTDEDLATTIAYLEKRLRDSLPQLVAEAVMNYQLTSAVDNKTVAPFKQFVQWLDRATNAIAKKTGA